MLSLKQIKQYLGLPLAADTAALDGTGAQPPRRTETAQVANVPASPDASPKNRRRRAAAKKRRSRRARGKV